jgi:hypothetical protein
VATAGERRGNNRSDAQREQRSAIHYNSRDGSSPVYRQSQAHEEKKARIIESKKKAAAAKVNLAAAVESADLMADIAMIEKEKVYYHKATRAICKTRPHATRRRWRGDFLVLRTPRAQNESYHAKVHQFYMPKTPESMRWLDSGPEIWAPTYPSHTHTRSCP